MFRSILISIVLLFVCIGVSGCEEFFTAFGIGVATGETVISWEENLETKGIELAAEYEKQIQAMRDANSPEELKFAKEKANMVQIAITANDSAKVLAAKVKSKEVPKSLPDALNLLIPIALAYGGNELRKRLAQQKKSAEENIKLNKKYSASKTGLEAIRIKHPESYEENYALVGMLRDKAGV